ncbi:hypothetical protein [Actinopolyspora mortivallis]|uniref:hypothetical protein n=1 Tax=Actinopolyspora mortivallis TaxID=33906 RepID=UPI0011B1FD04|nr:hypothetical protein [Actinopolyspora mortivallis]
MSITVELGAQEEETVISSAYQSGEKSILVRADTEQLTLDRLERLYYAAANNNVSLGVEPLKKRDEPEDHVVSNKTLIVSAVDKKISISGEEVSALPEKEITKRWGVIGILGHGDGMHLNLGQSVLCGLVGDTEKGNSGKIVDGCSYDQCKKAREIPSVFRTSDLECELLVLFSCTSMLLARQLYPSDLSLAFSAWSTKAARYVIGTTRQTSQSYDEIEHLIALIADGYNVGEAVLRVNSERDFDKKGALVLLGNPEGFLNISFSRKDKEQSKSKFPNYSYQKLLKHSRNLGTGGIISRLQDTERIERAIDFIVKKSLGKEHHLIDLLHSAREERIKLNETAWAALAHEQMLGYLTQSLRERLESIHSSWRQSMFDLLKGGLLTESHPGASVGDMLQPALSLWLHQGNRRPSDGFCPHCSDMHHRTSLSLTPDPDAGTPTRVQLDCAACGLAGHRAPLPPLTFSEIVDKQAPLRKTRGGVAGEKVEFELQPLPWLSNLTQASLLQLRDKTKRDPEPLVEINNMLPDAPTEITFPLPADAGSDISSVRLVVIADGGIDFYRCIFPINRETRSGNVN